MTKLEVLKSLIGRKLEYYYLSKSYKTRQDLIKELVKLVKTHNQKNKDNITYEIKDDLFNFSNGDYIRLPLENKTGILTQVRSKDIIVNGVHIDIKDISLRINNRLGVVDGFVTKNNGVFNLIR